MNTYLEAKCKYKNIYKLCAPSDNEIEIVYRLLTWQEYLSYTSAIDSGATSSADIEEDIFKKCVIDDSYTECMEHLLAGDVLTVVNLILTQSGPQNVDEIDEKLNEKREAVHSLNNQIISIICQAFPGYTPDIIEKMDWETIIERLTLAESILIAQGILQEPIQISGNRNAKDNNSGKHLDFDKINRTLAQDDLGSPPGDWNLDRKRSR